MWLEQFLLKSTKQESFDKSWTFDTKLQFCVLFLHSLRGLGFTLILSPTKFRQKLLALWEKIQSSIQNQIKYFREKLVKQKED